MICAVPSERAGDRNDVTPSAAGPDAPRFHGRRRGRKLRAAQQRLLKERLPGIAIGPQDVALLETPDNLFAPPVGDVWLEIGFGAGEHLAEQATRHPNVGFIGAEPFVNGVAQLLAQIDARDLVNVRILADDVRPLLAAMPAGCLGRVFVLFPDPWPKVASRSGAYSVA